MILGSTGFVIGSGCGSTVHQYWVCVWCLCWSAPKATRCHSWPWPWNTTHR